MDRSQVALIIPAYNEALTITKVVEGASKYGQTIVVDDCSSDGTPELAKEAGAIVITHKFNQGYDAALNTGFFHAAKLGFETVVTLDADGQHDCSLLIFFLKAFDEGFDLVLGRRSSFSRITEYLFAFYTKFRYGIDDPLCGMKGYRMSIYKSLGHFDTYNSIGTELALSAVKKNVAFKQIFFTVKNRLDNPRFGHSFSANCKILRSILFEIVKR